MVGWFLVRQLGQYPSLGNENVFSFSDCISHFHWICFQPQIWFQSPVTSIPCMCTSERCLKGEASREKEVTHHSIYQPWSHASIRKFSCPKLAMEAECWLLGYKMTSVNNSHCEETCLQLVAICTGAAVNIPCSSCDLVLEQHRLQLQWGGNCVGLGKEFGK